MFYKMIRLSRLGPCRTFAALSNGTKKVKKNGSGETMALSNEIITPDVEIRPHHFDSYQIVSKLEAGEFEHHKAMGIMRTMRALLMTRFATVRAETLSTSHL